MLFKLCTLSLQSCNNTALAPMSLASTSNLKGKEKFGATSTGALHKIDLAALKAC